MYYLLIILILFLYSGRFSANGLSNEKYEKWCGYIICASLVLLAAFRSNAVGTDTEGYRYDYESLSSCPDLQSLIDRYTIDYIVYFGLSKLFSLAHLPVQVWFGFIEAFYLFALVKLVNRYSMDRIFSLLVYTTIGLFSFSMTGEKQTLAASFMMLGFVCFLDKKYMLAGLSIVATYFTHQAVLAFLAVYPLYFLRKTNWMIPLIILSIGLMYIYSQSFLTSMVELLQNDHFEDYITDESSYSYVTFVFYVVITLIAWLNLKDYIEEEPADARFFFGASVVGCGLQLLAGVSPSLFRLALIYTPFMMVLLPNSLFYSKTMGKGILRIVLFGCLIFYFLYTGRNTPYSFY